MSHYYLAIDCGTGSGRAVLFDQKGRQVAVGQKEWTHRAEESIPGSMGFDCTANWKLICDCIAAALQGAGVDGKAVRAVSSTSMREGIVLYDRAGHEIWACANVDSRAAKQVAMLKARNADIEKRFYLHSGQTFALGAWPRLEWVRENRPDLFEATAAMTMINDWVTFRLSGELSVEPSNAGTSGLMDPAMRQWSGMLISEAGLDQSMFPRTVEPGTEIGRISAKAADETGLAVGTPVIAGGGDVQLGTLGLGVVDPGQAAILGGTFWQQVINVPTGRVDPAMRVRINPHAVPSLNQAECISFFVGLAMRWFRDTFGTEEVAVAAKTGKDAYALLEELAAAVPPGANGIIPIFSDAMDFGHWYHAAPSFLNMSIAPGHTTRGSLFRAMQENAAIVSAVNLERVRAFSNVEITGPVVFAGGASKGTLWPQILADVLEREVAIPEVKEATALGCAAAAAAGVGDFCSLAEAGAAFIRRERVVVPNLTHRAIYSEARERWLTAYAAQKSLVDQGITQAMWRAPGV